MKGDHIIQVDGSMKAWVLSYCKKVGLSYMHPETLMPVETGYSSIERELLTVVFRLQRLHHCTFNSRLRYKLTTSL